MNRHLTRPTLLLIAGAVLTLTACGSGGGSASPSSGGSSGGGADQAVMPSGCGKKGALMLAVAGHANAPKPVLTARMQAAVDTAMSSHTPIGVMSVEGRPTLVRAGVFSSDAGNATARAGDAADFVSSVAAAVAEVRATTPHVDDLLALQMAADSVRAACPRGGTVLFEDPGLPDRGALNFAASDLLQASPTDIVTFLRQHSALPSLSGIAVVLDVGSTAAPQQPLTVTAGHALTAIWSAVATAAGARAVTIDPSPLGGPAPTPVPPVDTVRVAAEPVLHVHIKPVGTTAFTLPDSGPVGFAPDRAIFRDPAAATAEIVRLADQITAVVHRTGSAHVTLVGTTSSAGGSSAQAEAGRLALSRARAAAVERVLVAHGVPAALITIRGVGTRFAQYEKDTDGAGDLLPGPAEHNRSVRVTVVAG